MNRALLVGINEYPTQPLSGCVNDVVDIAAYLEAHRGFSGEHIDMLLDGRATKRAIMRALRDMIAGARAGDRLLFHYSGHGTQMPASEGFEPDGLDEVLCPVDFDWTDATALRDNDLNALLRALPAGVAMTVVLDSCHSGDSARDLKRARIHRQRFLAPPPDIRRKLLRCKRSLHKLHTEEPRALFVSACASTELAADALFEGRPNGAFTYHMLRALRGAGAKSPVRQLVELIGEQLGDYDMHPEVLGPVEALAAVFLYEHAVAAVGAAAVAVAAAVTDEGAAHVREFVAQVLRIEREYRPRLQTLALPAQVASLLELVQAFEGRSPLFDAEAPRVAISCRSFPWGVQVEIPRSELVGAPSASSNGRRE